MPRKPIFPKDIVISAALSIVQQNGVEALTARELADRLGCSSRPIFTLFSGMDDVLTQVKHAAMELYNAKVIGSIKRDSPLESFCLETYTFAKSEPKLFRMMFMNEQSAETRFQESIPNFDGFLHFWYDAVARMHKISMTAAIDVTTRVFTIVYGYCVLCANHTYDLPEETVRANVRRSIDAFLAQVRKEGV